MRTIATLAALASLAGCRSDGTIPTVAVKGTVMIDGAALPDGFVVFYPDIEGAAPVSAIVVNGKFEVPAISPGKYKAAVRSNILDKPADGAIVDSSFGAPAKQPKPDPVPPRYREPSIAVEIVKTDEPIKIELTRK